MSDLNQKFCLPQRYQPKEKNLWIEYYELASKYKPVDLGSGCPDFPPPQYVQDAVKEVANNGSNHLYQYTRGAGHLRLVSALSKFYSKLIGREINPHTEIVTTLGCYHALFLAINALVDEGDEVIIIEPFFEAFKQNVKNAGGIPRFFPLKLRESSNRFLSSEDWVLDFDDLATLFNDKTKAIIVNTPHNPLGKVFSLEELSKIADLCKKWNVVCIADEVYQFLVYGSKKHIRMATLPDMWERTITVNSAGKAFGATGWKLGWAYGPAHLIDNLQRVHFSNVRAGNTFLQEVVAICFEKELSRLGSEESYFVSLAKELEVKRNFLFEALSEAGLKPIKPEGGYFMVANWKQLEPFMDFSEETDFYKDYKCTKWLTKNIGVQAIPVTPFYGEDHKRIGESFIRFCFVKTDSYLEKAAQILKNWKPHRKQ